MDTVGRTFICSVVFLDLVGYSRLSISRQVTVKQELMGLIAKAQAPVAEGDCIVLDTGDGAALGFLAGPEDALFAASTLVSEAHTMQPEPLVLRVGLHIGPVKRVQDINGRPNLIGDGINVAERIMSFCEPGQVLVSRAYYEVVACLSDDYARLFFYQGVHQDKHVREHELYRLNFPGGASCTDAPEQPPPPAPPDSTLSPPAKPPVTKEMPELPQAYSPDTEEIDRVGKWATQLLGPLARLLVNRARQGVLNREEWLANVAQQLPEEARAHFAEVFATAPTPGSQPTQPAALTAAPPPQFGKAAKPISETERSALLRMVSQALGPIAKVILRRAEQKGGSLAELIENLGAQIDEPKAREQFLTEARRLLPGA